MEKPLITITTDEDCCDDESCGFCGCVLQIFEEA